MLQQPDSLEEARALAEILDAAVANDWTEDVSSMVLLWQASDDPDDLRVAIKQLDGAVEEELLKLDEDSPYLAVAHSIVTRRPPAELVGPADGPVRITVAVDYRSQSGVVRHPNGATQWFGAAVDVPVAHVLRSHLWLEAVS